LNSQTTIQIKHFLYKYLGSGLLILLALFVSTTKINANNAIHELKEELSMAQSDTSKMKITYRIAYRLRTVNPTEALEYADQGLAIAKTTTDKKYLAAFQYVKGRILKRTGDLQSAEISFNDAINTYNSLKKSKKITKKKANVINALGNLFISKGEFVAAQKQFEQALSTSKELNDSILISVNYNDLGIVCFNQGNYALASDYYLKAVRLREALDHSRLLMLSYNNLGVLNKKYNKYNVAMDYYKKGLDLALELNDQLRILTFYNNIASIYRTKKNFEKAQEYLKNGLQKSIAIDSKANIAQFLFTIGSTYGDSGNYEKSIAHLTEAYNIYETIEDKYGIAKSSIELGQAYNNIGDWDTGIKFLLKGKEFETDNPNFIGLQSLLDNLSYAYSNIGEYKKAYDYKKQHQELNDSLSFVAAEASVLKLQQEYEDKVNTRQKEKEIAILNSEKILKASQTKSLLMALGFVSLLSLLLLLFGIRTKKMNIRLNEQNAVIENQNTSLKDTNQKFKIAKEMAEAAAKAKEEFLSTMSHEIRTPMNAVIGMTNILLDEEPRDDQVENLQTLQFSANNLLCLINDILDFSKIEAGKIELEKTAFNLRGLAKNLMETLKVTSKRKDIELLIDFQIDDLDNKIIGDPTRITQIVTNLLSNAIKFTEKGHVKFICKVQEFKESSVDLFFAIEDTGIGIPADRVDAIFESFTQASSSTTRKFGGTGLGLAITKRLVELQGGEIDVVSKVGVGSTFHFCLNFELGDKLGSIDEVPDIIPISRTGLAGKRILLAEDNKINQLVATKILNKWNIEITIANDGVEAVKHIEEGDFDLVLMDINMPNMDGYTAAEKIRQLADPTKSNIPIIALTASILSAVDSKVFSVGMNAHVGKPFRPSELFTVICSHIGSIEETNIPLMT